MSGGTDTRDRVIRLEAQVEQLTRDVAGMDEKVSEIHTLLQQARGAKWMLVLLWIALGALLADLGAMMGWAGIG